MIPVYMPVFVPADIVRQLMAPPPPPPVPPVPDDGSAPVTIDMLVDLFDSDDDDYDPVFRSATITEVRLFTEQYVAEPSAAQCAVCHDAIAAGQVCRRLPCGHGFHMGCIDRALEERITCPVCRHPITAPPPPPPAPAPPTRRSAGGARRGRPRRGPPAE